MANNTLWVHGNAARFQGTTGVTNIEYTGPGLSGTFALDAEGWVHIPLAAPIESDNEQIELVAVHVKAELGEVEAGEVAIYDGPNRILVTTGFGDTYLFSPPKKISYGIGISLQLWLQHGPDDNNPKPQTIVINAAGIEYTAPVVFTKNPNGPTSPAQGQSTN